MTDLKLVMAAANVMGAPEPLDWLTAPRVRGSVFIQNGAVWVVDATGPRPWNPLTSDADCWQLFDFKTRDFPFMRFVDLLNDLASIARLDGLNWLFSLPGGRRRRLLTAAAVQVAGDRVEV